MDRALCCAVRNKIILGEWRVFTFYSLVPSSLLRGGTSNGIG
jgi:hypothetical protein